MLKVLVWGDSSFTNQIKNRIQKLFESGKFSYTHDPGVADIIISEEEFPESEKTGRVSVYIEVLKGPDGKMCAAQQVAGEKTDVFLLKDLSSVLQGTILMVELLSEEKKQYIQVKKNAEELDIEQKGLVKNLKNAKQVQQHVMEESRGLKNYDTSLRYMPKFIISGDFVVAKEIFGKLFVFFGDVTEHGVYAAEYAASLVSLAKGYFDGCSQINASLEQFMMYMARAAFYYHGGCAQSSCECVLCEIDESSDMAKCATFSGGNISPIIATKDGKVRVVFDETVVDSIKPRLGDIFYEDNVAPQNLPGIITTPFRPGDSALFYSDGYSELFNGENKDQMCTYGVQNMEKSVKDACEKGDNSPEKIISTIEKDISSYGVRGLSESSEIKDMISDDATMFGIRRRL